MARRGLSEVDRGEWAAYVRHVAALPGRAVPVSAPAVTVEPAPRVAAATVAVPRVAGSSEVAVGAQPAGLDKSTWAKLRTGKLPPTRTLDLHGRTAQHAFQALQGFLQQARLDRVRCVEIITGRGVGEGGGVIRRELPFWLNLPQVRPLVLAVTHPHAANVGSVRVLLRRVR